MPNKFDIEPDYCPDEFLELARTELRETQEVREAAIKKCRELLLETKDLYYGTEDEFLIIFLRPCKWYPESAIKLMRAVAEFRKTYQDLVYNLNVDDLKTQFTETQVVNILPNRDQKGRRVMVVNSGQLWDPKVVTEEQMFQLFYIIHLIAQLEPVTQIAGVVVIMDFDGLGMKQVKSITPGGSKRLLTFIQKAMPLRLKEVHFVKQPFVFKVVWALLKPFVEEKLNKRMYFHGSDMKKLHELVDPNYLPANYGGNLPAIDYSGKDWYPCVDNYKDHIERWSHYGLTELKDKPKK